MGNNLWFISGSGYPSLPTADELFLNKEQRRVKG